jgi:hypothetical protein
MDKLKILIKKALEEESVTGAGPSAGTFTPGTGAQYATPNAFKKGTNSKGTKNIYYYKLGFKPVKQTKLSEAQLDTDAYIDSLNIEDKSLKTHIKSRLEGFDTIEKKLNELVPLLQKAKQRTLDYYKNKPNYSVVYGTDLANDYLTDLIDLFKN